MTVPPQIVAVMRRALAWTFGYVCAGSLYLLLIDTTSLPELLAGAGGTALAATGFELVREQHILDAEVHPRWLIRLARPVMKVPSDIWAVSVAAVVGLVRRDRSVGEFRTASFRCGESDEIETGRQALAESFGSFAPNTIIVGVDPTSEQILAHQLHVTGGREAVDVLELG